jgi:hypothetical protein
MRQSAAGTGFAAADPATGYLHYCALPPACAPFRRSFKPLPPPPLPPPYQPPPPPPEAEPQVQQPAQLVVDMTAAAHDPLQQQGGPVPQAIEAEIDPEEP